MRKPTKVCIPFSGQCNSNCFQSVEKKPNPKPPAFSKTLQIDRVALGSPAADLKLRPGDKLLSVNGKAALIEDIPALLAKSGSVQYRFFLPRESAFLEAAKFQPHNLGMFWKAAKGHGA